MKKIYMGLATMAAALLCEQEASASEIESAVAACYVTSGTASASLGTLANIGSGTVVLQCGFGKLSTGSALSTFVDFSDGSSSAGVSCTAAVVNFNGSIAWTGATQTSGSASTGAGFFNWSVPQAVAGYGVIACSLPNSSAIHGINVQ